MKKWDTSSFIERAKEIHGDYYDYSKVNYINAGTKVCIVCPVHGEFWQNPISHLRGYGCKRCGSIKYTTESFIEKSKSIFGDKYDYSKVVYIDGSTPIILKCNKHNYEFTITPHHHLERGGCKVCSNKTTRVSDFIEKANLIHNNKYDYSKVVIDKFNQKVTVICPIHGEFTQSIGNHLKGCGCPHCSKNAKITKEEFEKRVKEIFGDKYSYEKTKYVDRSTKVCVTCKEHGDFWIEPRHLFIGVGCPWCKNSHGENKIKEYLNKNEICFVSQYCVKNEYLFADNKRIFIDFYIPSLNVAIEYNGQQHYKPVEQFGGQEQFEKQQERDMALRQYCKRHKIKLIEIPYWDYDNIETILKKELKIK